MQRVMLIAIATATTWAFADASSAARCSYFASYPSAIGKHTFLLATATPAVVTTTTDTSGSFRPRQVPAQVMRVRDVAGYRTAAIRAGLRASGGTAVFVRYGISMSCGPMPALDGALDSAGVSGLYVASPRPEDRWVDGRPTFDVYRAPHYPLPQRLSGPSGHMVMTRVSSKPTMTARELFTMYRELWAESVSVGDRSPESRIRSWLARRRSAAMKHPAEEVAGGMLFDELRARLAAHRIPFGGTFAITVVVDGIDSLVTYAQTPIRTREWDTDVAQDSLTGVPVSLDVTSFAIDLRTAVSPSGFAPPNVKLNACPPIIIIVKQLPFVVDADSSWHGEMYPSGWLDCAPPNSPLAAFTGRYKPTSVAYGPGPVRFRSHPDGRVTFEARTSEPGKASILVRGERITGEVTPWFE